MKGLYAIADAGVLAARGLALSEFAQALRAAEVSVVQLRDKDGSPQDVLNAAALLSGVFRGGDCLLVMNDRPDLALLAGFGGVHVGQGDMSPEDVKLLSAALQVGVSTHTAEEVRNADAGAANYVAVGPVFATGTKADASPVVGLDGVRQVRALTGKPLVAIGGITLANAPSVFAAGADMVAVISGLFVKGRTVESVAREFTEISRGGADAL